MGWRDSILNEFVTDICKLTLVADPDGLLTEELLVTRLREKGFEIIEYEDAISFRYAYETKYRSLWDKGEVTDLVVVLRTQESDLFKLPYDLYKKGRKLSFSTNKLFPNLSSPVVEKLDKKYYDELFESEKNNSHPRIGDNATKDYILENVFGIKPSLISTTPQLLNLLLRIHYSEIYLPENLRHRITNLLQRAGIFKEWPLEILFSEKNAFFEFLQERWPLFVNSCQIPGEPGAGFIRSQKSPYGLKFPGPVNLPFDDEKVRIYIDDLFAEGKLKPVSCENGEKLKNTWVKFGIKDETQKDFISRIENRLKKLRQSIPKPDCDHSRWLNFSSEYAELKSLIYNSSNARFEITPEVKNCFNDISDNVNENFSEWLLKRYQGIINLPPVPPVIVNQIPRYLQRQRENNLSEKIALIVIDGLSLNQWFTIKKVLVSQNPKLEFNENSIFAWIPTLTSISRQAIFSGKIPLYFPESITTTSGEAKSWSNYWEDAGLPCKSISYVKNLIGENISEFLESDFNLHNTTIAGFVINTIDNIMHGMQLGEEGMHNQIEQWSKMGYLNQMLSYLLENNYNIWITSDHGNIESTGIGNPSEGAISDYKGERVRVYKDSILRDEIKKKYESAIEWDTPGLPNNFYPLFAPKDSSFAKKGVKSVSHGGFSIDETIVPFISVSGGKYNETP
ncbi:MAG: BREX-3 system phosphatase PglZ [Methanomicrobium sp.]|nr:BREX-3 system phosphatase PglZ [Methanomicrobium sp.]